MYGVIEYMTIHEYSIYIFLSMMCINLNIKKYIIHNIIRVLRMKCE